MNAEMTKYLNIAENVYWKIQKKYRYPNDLIEYLNRVLNEIKVEAAEKNLRLMYSYIDFEECLNCPMNERNIKVDLSILPDFDKQDECILWLANFIKSISEVKTNLYS